MTYTGHGMPLPLHEAIDPISVENTSHIFPMNPDEKQLINVHDGMELCRHNALSYSRWLDVS